jgi:hypothetical protein
VYVALLKLLFFTSEIADVLVNAAVEVDEDAQTRMQCESGRALERMPSISSTGVARSSCSTAVSFATILPGGEPRCIDESEQTHFEMHTRIHLSAQVVVGVQQGSGNIWSDLLR